MLMFERTKGRVCDRPDPSVARIYAIVGGEAGKKADSI